MGVEENRRTVIRYAEQVWNQRNLDAADELIDPRFKHRALDLYGPAAIKRDIGGIHNVFPDAKWVLQDTVAEVDKVTLRYTFHGTHTQEFLGLKPTGKKVEIAAIAIFRLQRQKIVEEWVVLDFHSFARQVGASYIMNEA